jgi:hypothetical protein
MKKKNYIPGWLFLFGIIFLALTACNKNEDLVTKDALEGGLVEPTYVFNYKLGLTINVDVPLTIPTGPGIGKIEVYNQFSNTADTTVTNKVLLTTITNPSSTVPLTFTYADLKKDLVYENGNTLPDDATQLAIGSTWTLTYVTYLTENGRKVINVRSTKIAVANAYAGKYHCSGTFIHPTAGPRPIDEDKQLVPTGANTVTTSVGDLGGAGYWMEITIDQATNKVTVAALPGTTELFMTTGKDSRYDPDAKKFYIYYYYVGGTGPRVIEEEYSFLE